jgi:hypothetical protein
MQDPEMTATCGLALVVEAILLARTSLHRIKNKSVIWYKICKGSHQYYYHHQAYKMDAATHCAGHVNVS